MIKIKLADSEFVKQFYLERRDLIAQSFSDEEIHYLVTGQGLSPFENWQYYLEIANSFTTVGVVRAKGFTNQILEIHPAVDMEWQGQNLSSAILRAIVAWVKLNTNYSSILIISPQECTQVHKAANKISELKLTKIKNGVKWRGKLQDLYMYIMDIRG